MARLRSSFVGLFVSGALLGVGCGSDSAPAENDDSTSGSQTGSKKDAGKDAGKVSDAGKKGDAGSAAAVASVECGSTTCKGTASPVPGIPAPMPCCFDEANEVCGVTSLTTGMCTGPAMLDDRCPSVMFGGNSVAGCCTDDDHCGIDATQLGQGCADLAGPMLRMFIPNAPPPQTCEGEPLELPGGSADAGGTAAGDGGTHAASDAGKADAGTASDAGKADAGKADAGK